LIYFLQLQQQAVETYFCKSQEPEKHVAIIVIALF